jgi:PAS domain S-box-containing protein
MSRVRALLVEDNPADVLLLKEALSAVDSAHEVMITHAANLGEALVCVRQQNVDMVLLDLNLPDSSGLESVRRIRESAPHLPIVVLTGLEDESLGVQAVAEGAQDYLVKGLVQESGYLVLRAMRYATERMRHQQNLIRTRKELQELITRTPDGIAILHGDDLAYVNPALVASLGYRSPEALVGKPLMTLMQPEERAPTAALLAAARAGEPNAGARETCFVRLDGAAAILEIHPGPEIEFKGAAGLLLVSRDVTDRRRMEARLLMADRMASLGTMAAGVAHEINNPLTWVVGSLDLALDELQCGEGRGLQAVQVDRLAALIAKARQGAERVRGVVRDFKSFSRADVEEIGPVDLRRVIEYSTTLAWNEVRHRARLLKSYSDVPPVLGNEARIGQVVLNLLLNAVHAIPEGTTDRNEIEVSAGRVGPGRVFFAVRDTGSGISREDRAHIFDPFFTTKPIGSGTGLGLSICHTIVASLDGEIEVESALGKGTTFRVVLPEAGCEKTQVERAKPFGRAAIARRAPPAPDAHAPPGRVLVVDDEDDVGSLLSLALEPHEVVVVTSGGEALELLAQDQEFDVVLCDLMMPVMAGMDLYAEILRTHRDVADRVVFITGGAFTPRAQAFLKGVHNPCFEKPFDLTQLFQLIESLVRRRRDRDGAPLLAP